MFSRTSGTSTRWRPIKWLCYVGLAAFLWVVKRLLVGPRPILLLGVIADAAQRHPYGAGALGFAWLVVLACGWLCADAQESFEKTKARVRLFRKGDQLEYSNFALVGFEDFYNQKEDFAKACARLRAKNAVLILGRSAGGKTRMAYQLAKQLGDHWVLRLDPEQLDVIDQLSFPAYRPKVVWFVDDLDRYVGKRPLDSVRQALGGRCKLRIIATCRTGEDIERVQAGKEMRSFIESIGEPVTCQDLSLDEWLSLARRTGKNARRDLYDGTPGSVTMRLDNLEHGLRSAGTAEQQAMRGIFLLRKLGIYSARASLLRQVITRVLSPGLTPQDLDVALTWLRDNDFLIEAETTLRPRHDVYLTRRVFPYYADHDPKLTPDLIAATALVEECGDGFEIASAGIYWGAEGMQDLALDLLRKAAAMLPGDPVVHFNLGGALYVKDRFEDSIAAYARAVDLRPTFFAAYNNLGNALDAEGRPEEAAAAYRKATKIQPRSAEAHYNLANALSKIGRPEQAIDAYHKAIKLRPRYLEAHNNLGIALHARGRSGHAIVHLREALKLNPDHANAHSNLGDALREKGQVGEAIAHLREALRLDPGHANAYMNLGLAFADEGQMEEAISSYRRAIELNPKLGNAYVAMAQAYGGLGKREEAKKALAGAHGLEVSLKFLRSPQHPFEGTGWRARLRRYIRAQSVAGDARGRKGADGANSR